MSLRNFYGNLRRELTSHATSGASKISTTPFLVAIFEVACIFTSLDQIALIDRG